MAQSVWGGASSSMSLAVNAAIRRPFFLSFSRSVFGGEGLSEGKLRPFDGAKLLCGVRGQIGVVVVMGHRDGVVVVMMGIVPIKLTPRPLNQPMQKTPRNPRTRNPHKH
jgi:hypothetical protein